MRAYGELRRTKKVQVVRDLLENVIDVHLFDGNDQVSKHIYGASFTSAEKLTRQYLFQMKSANYKLARSAICSFGGGYMQMLPLPKRWLDVVEVSGMRVKRISSKVVWLQSIFIYWAYGVWMILKIVAVSLHKTFTNQCIVRSPYSYFWQLSKNNLPEADENGVSYDICSWYAKWGERPEGVLNIRHGVHGVEKICIEEINVEYIDLPYYQISEFSKICTQGAVLACVNAWRVSEGKICSVVRCKRDCSRLFIPLLRICLSTNVDI
jgi:polysaccharide biosynthesis PFTS motif protein